MKLPSKREKNPTVGLSIHPLKRPVAAFRNVENEIYPKAKKPAVVLVTEELSEDEEMIKTRCRILLLEGARREPHGKSELGGIDPLSMDHGSPLQNYRNTVHICKGMLG